MPPAPICSPRSLLISFLHRYPGLLYSPSVWGSLLTAGAGGGTSADAMSCDKAPGSNLIGAGAGAAAGAGADWASVCSVVSVGAADTEADVSAAGSAASAVSACGSVLTCVSSTPGSALTSGSADSLTRLAASAASGSTLAFRFALSSAPGAGDRDPARSLASRRAASVVSARHTAW